MRSTTSVQRFCPAYSGEQSSATISMVTFCTLTSGQGDALTSTAECDHVLTLTAEHYDVLTLIPELGHVLTLTAQQHGNEWKRAWA